MFEFLSQKFSGILGWIKNKGRLTEKNIEESLDKVREALLEADVPYEVIQDFLNQIKNEVIGQKIQSKLDPGQHFIKIIYEKLLEFLKGNDSLPLVSFQIPSVVMVMGLQGSGKTTTIAKLANFVLKQAKKRGKKRKILFSSVDFYRPAAIEQLKILSRNVGVDFYCAKSIESLKAAEQIYDYFKNGCYEILFLDTAGRMHIDNHMMQELVQIDNNLHPKYKILVLDSMTGQESLNVAKAFDQSVGFNSAILSKMDSDARGGAAFAFKYVLKKTISFVGCGEKIDDLESFIPDRMATRILGMGDIATFIEKANENIGKDEQEIVAKRMLGGNFTLKDFASQLSMVGKLGSLQKVMKYIPGMGGISDDMMDKGEQEVKKFRAIFSSMTEKELLIPNVLDASRKKRIAKGAGVNIQDVNGLLQKFEQSKQFAKMFKKNGMFKRFFK
ncbi:signal recognition particle protein [Candidatus Babeliales bacterium]|nr:signal recognition particle protein [Candidatus Babeliales bacterium]